MQPFKTWPEFVEQAQKLLHQGQSISKYSSHLELVVEPTFTDAYCIQIEHLDSGKAKWYKTIWHKTLDAPKFLNPLFAFTHFAQAPEPNLSFVKGELTASQSQELVDILNNISLPLTFTKSGGISLDGTSYTLRIGVEKQESCFTWHNFPPRWKDAEQLVSWLNKHCG